MKEKILIVDAYNMIGNWPNLNKIKMDNRLEDARDELLKELAEYKKYEDEQIIVVFDAMYVPGNAKTIKDKQYDMDIVWTSKDQTADSYIESLAKEKQNRFTQVIVATSDQAEQWTVFSAGALRIPARELFGNITRTKKEVQKQTQKLVDKGLVIRNTPFDEETLLKLARLRDRLSK